MRICLLFRDKIQENIESILAIDLCEIKDGIQNVKIKGYGFVMIIHQKFLKLIICCRKSLITQTTGHTLAAR